MSEPGPEGGAEELELVRAADTQARAEEWSLVLTAVGIPHSVDAVGLFAPPEHAAAARAALAEYDEENRAREAPAEPAGYGETLCGAAFALLILAAGFGQDFAPARWADLGAADADLIRGGQWWRCATALSLHADGAHAAGNAAFGGVALTALAHRLGPAAACAIALASGVAGNFATALLLRSEHVSIGASTAVFGLLGALAGAQLVGPPARRRWLSLAAGAALLATLGTGPHTDVFAHLFGMLSGVLLGAAAAFALPRPPQRSLLQPLLSLAPLIALAGCWWRALR